MRGARYLLSHSGSLFSLSLSVCVVCVGVPNCNSSLPVETVEGHFVDGLMGEVSPVSGKCNTVGHAGNILYYFYLKNVTLVTEVTEVYFVLSYCCCLLLNVKVSPFNMEVARVIKLASIATTERSLLWCY